MAADSELERVVDFGRVSRSKGVAFRAITVVASLVVAGAFGVLVVLVLEYATGGIE